MKGDPTEVSKFDPRECACARGRGGWTSYEINVGHVPDAMRAGLNLRSIKFIQSADQKGSGAGFYAQGDSRHPPSRCCRTRSYLPSDDSQPSADHRHFARVSLPDR